MIDPQFSKQLALCVPVLVLCPVFLIASGNSDQKSRALLSTAIEERFPEIALERYIIGEEIETLITLNQEEQDVELLEEWESLIIDEKRYFPFWRDRYNIQMKHEPYEAFIIIMRLAARRPEYADRILYTLSIVIETSSYRDIFATPIAVIAAANLLKKEQFTVSSEILLKLQESIPDEKTYVLAFYQTMSSVFRMEFNADEIYRIYQEINRENYSELLGKSQFVKYRFMSNEDDDFGLKYFHQLQDLITERLKANSNLSQDL